MVNWKSVVNAGSTSINNLLIQHFQDLKFTSEEFVLFVNLKMFQELGIKFPSTAQLTHNTGFSAAQIYQLTQSLIDKKLIKIQSQTSENHKFQDYYDLSPVYEALQNLQESSKPAQKDDAAQTIFQKIEVEFGRPLSPIERQTIQEWLTQDNYSPEIINLALKEAVLNQVYSLKYIDRILINWEKQHITTAAQLQNNKSHYGGN
ncbi:DNA replication protein DnaD [Bombilactobacillus bombi]|jgi:DNA replication protein|uniref:DNA replication protein DnaD n=1 Tax=Bombilactobacillus bombi TaxID=1303590 RepID=A0A3R6YIT2_9LACO|nr:DnaD domain protein [Bombilactobacillus bombi]RHW45973.1 DNA replication protein DnaD [Bombilactobacillus bombi]